MYGDCPYKPPTPHSLISLHSDDFILNCVPHKPRQLPRKWELRVNRQRDMLLNRIRCQPGKLIKHLLEHLKSVISFKSNNSSGNTVWHCAVNFRRHCFRKEILNVTWLRLGFTSQSVLSLSDLNLIPSLFLNFDVFKLKTKLLKQFRILLR